MALLINVRPDSSETGSDAELVDLSMQCQRRKALHMISVSDDTSQEKINFQNVVPAKLHYLLQIGNQFCPTPIAYFV